MIPKRSGRKVLKLQLANSTTVLPGCRQVLVSLKKESNGQWTVWIDGKFWGTQADFSRHLREVLTDADNLMKYEGPF